MEPIDYIGEHTLAGQLGDLFIGIAFISVIFSGFSFFMGERNKDATWVKMGRISFRIHSMAILAIMGTLFVMLFNSWYEYDYVWKHRNNEMPLRYIFSCFWEGFEGAFILWALWHALFGNIVMSRVKEWQAPVLSVISAANVFIMSMVLGIFVFDVKIGNSPFMLIRELESNIGLPWTTFPDYLERFPQFADGRGLNPLLQNYWMVIHPPTVFLGFASTIIPAAFAIAGIWRGKYREWIAPALPWTYLGIGILGTGILMGGVWAYEALSFGGFWAWDPVENASLVPWITLVAAGHVMMINLRKGDSVYTSIVLACVSFVFVIYSNFLTNSGILGDTSVHAFTDNGLTGQLLAYLLFFIALPVGLLMIDKRFKLFYVGAMAILIVFYTLTGMGVESLNFFFFITLFGLIYSYNRFFPVETVEEGLWSREFWMFIGSLVLVMSAIQISIMTSKPVFNELAGPFRSQFQWLYEKTNIEFLQTLATGSLTEKTQAEVIKDYNKWQVPFAFVTCAFVAVTQFFKYQRTDKKTFMRQLGLSTGLSALFTIGTLLLFGMDQWAMSTGALLFTSYWALLGNLDYMIRIMGGRLSKAGASIAHIGFAMILLGALVSTSQSETVSQNTTMLDITQLGEDFSNQEDILLFQNDTIMMNEFFIAYREKNREGINVYYTMDYFHQTPKEYKKGDLVYRTGKVYQAMDTHEAGDSFKSDRERYWKELAAETKIDENVRLWTNLDNGDEAFTLRPRIQLNPVFGNVSEPDTKHFIDRDIYTHIRYGELEEENEAIDSAGYRPAKEHKVEIGDTIRTGGKFLILDTLRRVNDLERYGLTERDIAVKAEMRVIASLDTTYSVEPVFVLKESMFIEPIQDEVDDLKIKVQFTEIEPEKSLLTFKVAEHKDNVRDFVVMQAIVFPWINILWMGIIIMGLGTFVAVRERFRINSVKGGTND